MLLERLPAADRRLVSGTSLASVYCLGGAFIGLWLLVRFPTRAPKSFAGAAIAFLLAGGALSIIPALLTYAVEHGGEAGALLGLVGLVLPAATAVFWSLACLVRVFSRLG